MSHSDADLSMGNFSFHQPIIARRAGLPPALDIPATSKVHNESGLPHRRHELLAKHPRNRRPQGVVGQYPIRAHSHCLKISF